ncbi:hypothetical protein C0J52_02104 [Blattella germanica]|nr:hypothetical protein C0J52_02104 [Blattella germanica]
MLILMDLEAHAATFVDKFMAHNMAEEIRHFVGKSILCSSCLFCSRCDIDMQYLSMYTESMHHTVVVTRKNHESTVVHGFKINIKNLALVSHSLEPFVNFLLNPFNLFVYKCVKQNYLRLQYIILVQAIFKPTAVETCELSTSLIHQTFPNLELIFNHLGQIMCKIARHCCS